MRSVADHVNARRGCRKVLLIAEAAPPTVGPDVQSSTEFAKNLPQCGWLPTVWTADDVEELAGDPAFCEEWPTEAAPRITGSGVLAMRRSLRGFVNARAGEGLTAVASRFAKASDERLEARPSANSQPDDDILLARRIDALARQIRSERFDVIYSTCGNGSAHRLALRLKRRTNLPWAADFRDAWIDDSRDRGPSPQCRAAHRPWEQEILEAADVIITVSERQRRMLADRVPGQRDKFSTIIHGCKSPDSAGLESFSSIEPARQLAYLFDRLADRAAETVDHSLATCRP